MNDRNRNHPHIQSGGQEAYKGCDTVNYLHEAYNCRKVVVKDQETDFCSVKVQARAAKDG